MVPKMRSCKEHFLPFIKGKFDLFCDLMGTCHGISSGVCRYFTSNPALVAFTKNALRVYMAVMFMFGIQISCQMAFNSLGKAISSIVVAVMRKFVLLIPLIYIMPHIFHSIIRQWLFTWQNQLLILLR